MPRCLVRCVVFSSAECRTVHSESESAPCFFSTLLIFPFLVLPMLLLLPFLLSLPLQQDVKRQTIVVAVGCSCVRNCCCFLPLQCINPCGLDSFKFFLSLSLTHCLVFFSHIDFARSHKSLLRLSCAEREKLRMASSSQLLLSSARKC